MRKLLLLILFILASCVSTNKIPEGVIIKTKVYVGKYESSYAINDKYTNVLTTMGYFKIKDINSWQASCDLIWALVNSKEFLYRH